jgi:DNA-binding transcriptional LysR family regulator
MMDLNAVRDFLVVAEHGSYAEAGRVLGLPKSTLSRRVAALEQSLGVRLMERNSRRLRLTTEGDELRERATSLVTALADLEEQVRPGDAPLKGRLRISVPVLLGYTVLGRIAARFAAAHPEVLLEAVVDDRKVDLLREGFDAAVRVNPTPDSLLSGRLLGRNRLLLVAAPSLIRHLGQTGKAPQDFTWPAVVRRGWGDDGGWDVAGERGRVRVRAVPRLDLSSPLAIRDAVLAGAGAAFLPRTLAEGDLAEGRLVKLGERHGDPEEVWIVHASGRLPSRRLRALIDVMVAFFADEPLTG